MTKYILWTDPPRRPGRPRWERELLPRHVGRQMSWEARLRSDEIVSGHMYRLPPTDDGRQRRLEVIEP